MREDKKLGAKKQRFLGQLSDQINEINLSEATNTSALSQTEDCCGNLETC